MDRRITEEKSEEKDDLGFKRLDFKKREEQRRVLVDFLSNINFDSQLDAEKRNGVIRYIESSFHEEELQYEKNVNNISGYNNGTKAASDAIMEYAVEAFKSDDLEKAKELKKIAGVVKGIRKY